MPTERNTAASLLDDARAGVADLIARTQGLFAPGGGRTIPLRGAMEPDPVQRSTSPYLGSGASGSQPFSVWPLGDGRVATINQAPNPSGVQSGTVEFSAGSNFGSGPVSGAFLSGPAVGNRDAGGGQIFVPSDNTFNNDGSIGEVVVTAIPPLPKVNYYDYTKGSIGLPGTLYLSKLKSGDQVIMNNARVVVRDRGAVDVTLSKGVLGRVAGSEKPVIVPVGPSYASVDKNIEASHGRSPFWFRKIVPNKAPLDYKQDKTGDYEAFGNFNYGATGREVGFPAQILYQRAGAAQLAAHSNEHPEFGKPGIPFIPRTGIGNFGDDPIDQFWTAQGVRYHDTKKK